MYLAPVSNLSTKVEVAVPLDFLLKGNFSLKIRSFLSREATIPLIIEESNTSEALL